MKETPLLLMELGSGLPIYRVSFVQDVQLLCRVYSSCAAFMRCLGNRVRGRINAVECLLV